jgi:hypothetical protein
MASRLSAVELNALTAADWQPALDVLDVVVGSLHYGGTETGEEAPPVEGGGDQSGPFGIVSAAAGVNIRSGPSTAFPIIGNAAFGTQLELTGRSANVVELRRVGAGHRRPADDLVWHRQSRQRLRRVQYLLGQLLCLSGPGTGDERRPA